jgi:AcrR family transcriptional regulator
VAGTDGRPQLGRPGPGEMGRRRILDAAARVFAQRGYLATTIDAIADELGATKGRVYHYYRGKAEIFLDVVVTGMIDLIEELEPISKDPELAPRERIYAMARNHALLMMVRNPSQRVAVQALELRTVPEIALHVDTLAQVRELRRRYERLFADVLDEGVTQHDFDEASSGLVIKAALGALNWIPIWYDPQRSSEEYVDRVADTFARFILNGLKGE